MEDDDYKPQDNTYIVEGSIFDYSSAEEPAPYNSSLSRFSRLMSEPENDIDLAEAALLIAAQEYPGLNENYYLEQLDALADEVRPLIVTETDPLKNIEHLNYFLTHVKGYHGNEAEYSDRRNSYFNDVLERHTGLPITLSLLYIELGKRLGLHFEGIGLPGHFIIRYRELAPQVSGWSDRLNAGSNEQEVSEEPGRVSGNRAGDILLDPFNGGQILIEEDCFELVKGRYGSLSPAVRQAFLRPVMPRQFIQRLITNLKVSCIGEEDFEQAWQYEQYLIILNPDSPEERRDRAELGLRTDRFGRAIVDYQTYLRQAPDAKDANQVRNRLKVAFDRMVARN